MLEIKSRHLTWVGPIAPLNCTFFVKNYALCASVSRIHLQHSNSHSVSQYSVVGSKLCIDGALLFMHFICANDLKSYPKIIMFATFPLIEITYILRSK